MNPTTVIAPGALPLLGHSLQLLRAPLRFLRSMPEHGDMVDLRIGPSTATLICSPDLVRQVLADPRTFERGGFLFDQFKDVVGNGLGTCPYADHPRQRRLVQPAFTPHRMPGYEAVMTGKTAAVTDSWRHGQTIDVCADMERISTQITLAAMFPVTTPPELLATISRDVACIFHDAIRVMLFPWAGKRRFTRAVAHMHQSVDTIIADHRPDGTEPNDLLSLLLSPTEPGEPGLPSTEIVDQVNTFFVAGMEPTSILLAWTLYALSQHPDVQQRVHVELDEVLGGAPPTVADLPRLSLTTRVVTETLRRYPPSWIFTRITTADTQLGARSISAGHTIVLSPYLLHLCPDLFAEPDRFDPERWVTGKPRRGAFVPFGGGPRRCLGEAFATTAATLALVTILNRWNLETIPGKRVRPAARLSYQPRGLRLRVLSRDRNHVSHGT